MAETPQDVVNRELREFKRYTGDGLPGEPVNAPLPVGDPQSGTWNPKKKNLRSALLAPLEVGDEAVQAAERAEFAADRAENAASSFAEVATNFKTVTDLLADETMGYAGSGKDVIVGEGDIITAQGFRYEVAAASATDHHLQTAGSVKLFVLPGENGMNVAAFGAVGDGVADDTAPIQKAADSLKDAFPNWYASSATDGPAALFFPRGLFRITDTIAVPKGILIHGLNARNNGGSQIFQETTGKWIFDLYGYEFLTGGNDTRREADQFIRGLFFRSAGGGIRMDRRDHPGADGYSMGSARVKDCYFLNVDGGDGYAAIWAEALEEVSGCTFDYMQSPAFRGRSCHVFANNTCWAGFVSDPDMGTGFEGKSIVTGNWFAAGDGTIGHFGGGVVHLGNNTTYECDLTVTSNQFTKISGGGGGFGILVTGKLNSLQAGKNSYRNLTYPAIHSTGEIVNAKIDGEFFQNVEGASVGSVVELNAIYSGSFSNNAIIECDDSVTLVNASSLTAFSILNNDFAGNTRTTADILVTTASKTRISGNRNKSIPLVITVTTVDGECEIQGRLEPVTGTVNGFVSNFSVKRENGQLTFQGEITRSTAGSLARNSYISAGNQIATLPRPDLYGLGETMVRITGDGGNQHILPVFFGNSGEIWLGVVWDISAGLEWSSTLRIDFLSAPVPAAVGAG